MRSIPSLQSNWKCGLRVGAAHQEANWIDKGQEQTQDIDTRRIIHTSTDFVVLMKLLYVEPGTLDQFPR